MTTTSQKANPPNPTGPAVPPASARWSGLRLALRIAIPYAVVAILWVLLSDWLLFLAVGPASMALTWQLVNGLGLVVVTGTLLAVLVMRHVRHLETIRVRERTSEARFQYLLTSVTDYVYTVAIRHGEAVETKHGAGCEAVTGYTPADYAANRMLWAEMIPADDQPAVITQAAAALRGEQPPPLEHRLQHKNGSLRWVSSTLVPQRDAEGRLVAYEGLVSDITERKQAEMALREAATQLRESQRVARLGSYTFDVARGRWSSSTILDEIFGITDPGFERDVAGWMRVICPDDRDSMLHYLQDEVVAANRPFNREYRIIRLNDGAERWVHGLGELIPDPSGRPARMIGTIQDITERKAAEERLHASETRYRFLAENITDVVWTADLEPLRFTYISPSIVRLTGFTSDEQLARSPRDTVTPETWRMLEKELHLRVPAYVAGDCAAVTRQYEVEQYRRDGSTVWVEVITTLFRDPGREGIQVLGVSRDITPRRRAELALRESEERLRRVIDHSHAGYFFIDRAGCIQVVNDAWLELHGYADRSEVIGRHFSTMQVEADLEAANAVVERLLAGDTVPPGEFTRRCRDGSVGYHTFSASPVRQGGETIGLEGFIIDTTALRRARAEYEQLFSAMIDGFALHEIICDDQNRPVDYRFLAVNPAFERMTGLKAGLILGRRVLEVLPGIEHYWIETYGRVALTGEPVTFTNYSGDLQRHFEISAFRPAPGRFACVVVDITQRKLAEEALARDEAQLAAIYAHAPIMMLLLDGDLRIRRLNEAAIRFAGRTEEEVRGIRPGELLSCLQSMKDPRGCGFGDDCANCKLRLTVLDTLETGTSHNRVETQPRIVLGRRERNLAMLVSTARLQIGDERLMLLCLEDVTEQKHLEQQFREAQKQEAVGQLAGGVAHDFNNILAAMLLNIELARREPSLAPAIVETFRELDEQAHRAAALTRQLLLFSRRQAMQIKPVDVNDLLDNILRMIRRLLGENIAVQFQSQPGVPLAEADPGMVEQVVMNLCVNARDAMPNGGQLTLSTAVVEYGQVPAHADRDVTPGPFVRISVADTGTGMDAVTLERIFEPFFTTKEVGRGTGLGLATVHGIVRQHRGWIDVESVPDAGSTFHVFLPTSVQPRGDPASDSAPAAIARGTETLLVVEDQADVRRATTRLLRGAGYQVIEAVDGSDALAQWERREGAFDLLLTDMVMPGNLSGLELAQRLRAGRPSLKIIITSGYSQKLAVHNRAATSDMVFLQKPCSGVELERTVRETLDRERGAASD